MIVRFPSYYNKFGCIADKCRHSCCVGWEIALDEETMEKYSALGREDILRHVKDGEIVLSERERCPFLCDSGLCRLISEFGDSYTSIICREHPRFYHRVGETYEGGIGMCCEEAARIILSDDGYADFVGTQRFCEAADETDFDSISHRDEIYGIIGRREHSFADRLCEIKLKYRLAEVHSCDEWNEILLELEYLYPEHRGMIRASESFRLADEYLERFFAYLVFRHVSVANSFDNLCARLGFCILLTRILGSGASNFDEACDLARIISEEIEYSEDNTDSLIFEIESGF
jgi:lysine-N-methylase